MNHSIISCLQLQVKEMTKEISVCVAAIQVMTLSRRLAAVEWGLWAVVRTTHQLAERQVYTTLSKWSDSALTSQTCKYTWWNTPSVTTRHLQWLNVKCSATSLGCKKEWSRFGFKTSELKRRNTNRTMDCQPLMMRLIAQSACTAMSPTLTSYLSRSTCSHHVISTRSDSSSMASWLKLIGQRWDSRQRWENMVFVLILYLLSNAVGLLDSTVITTCLPAFNLNLSACLSN